MDPTPIQTSSSITIVFFSNTCSPKAELYAQLALLIGTRRFPHVVIVPAGNRHIARDQYAVVIRPSQAIQQFLPIETSRPISGGSAP